MPKQEDECPICGTDFDEEDGFWICRHCGYFIDKNIHKVKYARSIHNNRSIHNERHFNPSSRDDLDTRPIVS
jgi:ribosomal protein L37AE/L43A